ncbi:GNAT family N-acetyltransferase [Achromobacter aloeverae]|uniref:GNAT family N-acetyltransferase n=1 Tax=Achromobacter aloeverae TaxID=1750518 RepID=A0A4Q1HF97_9BURK|nr:GNAT family N-acetyltransferase [Achromobacter aloeverae]RXN85289.1 GNAT family N-acetyltransferase [Achromobacter aloeverae]
METTQRIEIRTPTVADSAAIARLLATLGYPGTAPFIERRIAQLISHPDEVMLAATRDDAVLGIISLHFIPQLALAGDFCRISYFCVSEDARGEGVGALLEGRAVEIARERGCDRIELHCHARRVDAHRFYLRQGYEDSPKYFFKSLA